MARRSGNSRDAARVASAWVFSILGHVAAAGLAGLLVASQMSTRASVPAAPRHAALDDDAVPIELPVVVGMALVSPREAPSLPAILAPRGGGEGAPRIDTGTEGHGGDDRSPHPAMNLADRDDGLFLSPDVPSRFDRSQAQRIRKGQERSSQEDWRASREPMELTFVAEGRLTVLRPDRRTPSKIDPSSGGQGHGIPQQRGGDLGVRETPPGFGESPRRPGESIAGGPEIALGRGVRDGVAGDRAFDAARTALARPFVDQGSPSVLSSVRGRTRDNVDSEQEAADLIQSIVHASTAGGSVVGPGRGGEHGDGAPGAGARSESGSTARALGTGRGSGLDNDPRDRRRTDYVRRILARIYPYTANAMPKWAIADGVQGVTIVSFTILADGSVSEPTITRPSGLPELDENCRRAVLAAAPFPPLPTELGGVFRWAMPFDFRNPAVRPRYTGNAHEPKPL